MRQFDRHDIYALLGYLALIALAILTSSCRSTKDVEQSYEAHSDTVYISRTKTDSIVLHDSIYEREYLQGDTVVRYKYVQLTQWRERLRVDTIYQSRTDTVSVIKDKVVTRESLASRFCRWVFWVLLAVAALYFTYRYIRHS